MHESPHDLVRLLIKLPQNISIRRGDTCHEHPALRIRGRPRASEHAIIEIKWLGQPVNVDGTPGTKYTDARALEGAQQMAEYLDATHQSSPHHGARGYLVLFDGRRARLKEGIAALEKDKALHYEHAHIAYKPDHSAVRSDFEPPVRMFLYPQLA